MTIYMKITTDVCMCVILINLFKLQTVNNFLLCLANGYISIRFSIANEAISSSLNAVGSKFLLLHKNPDGAHLLHSWPRDDSLARDSA